MASLRKQTHDYLRVKDHGIWILPSNGSEEKRTCMRANDKGER